ncbi:MAG: hypothetical protein OEZ65_00020 [Gemmatimonadota bacterium]|nr:hypothetical protein [Gemmatimonadota bacterium]MDH5757937.1 hypothetical protein [Gemmatimonadota bacterium]
MTGLPMDGWILLACAIGFGLVLEVWFFLARRSDRGSAGGGDA